MKSKTALLLFLIQCAAFAQQPEKDHSIGLNNELYPCLDAAAYQAIEQQITENRARLQLGNPGVLNKKATLLQWPVRVSAKLTDCNYYYISAFVDQDTTSGVKDWNCGTRTYNGHRGVDIVPWPFIWDKMDNNLVEVIAAAPGTIIAKADGNPDRVCNGVGGGSNSNNYISVQHADGSVALYVHMKTGSLTTKAVGQTVNTGEFLGIVGSAGQSTGVHLHFELRPDGTFAHYADPFFGACNNKISASWWANQKPYTEPALMKLSLHSSWPYMAVCPVTKDTTYEQDTFTVGKDLSAVFYACSKHVSAGDSWNFSIRNATGTTVDAWNYTSSSARNTSTLGFQKSLPQQAGIYTFEAVYLTGTCKKTFVMQQTTAVEKVFTQHEIYLLPTGLSKQYVLQYPGDAANLFPLTFEVYDMCGKLIHKQLLTQATDPITFDVSGGIYLLKLSQAEALLYTGKYLLN